MAVTIGSQLGSHEIVALLGKGGMGEVYRARDTRLKREVAIKILPDEFARDTDRVGRFQREAEVLASLNHPNIAGIYNLEEANGSRFLVLELVDGETLADRLARGPMPVDEALSVANSICEALAAAHEKGVVHRDLKPGNIKLTPDGKVKVLDFGLAKLAAKELSSSGEPFSNSPTMFSAATGAGMILGTAGYMSPEQARGKAVDKRSDIWAFACVLFEMLTGTRAFEGEDVTDTIAAVVRGTPNWDALPKDVPEQVRMLLQRCLEKDRAKRLPDISVAQFLMTEKMAPPVAPASTIPEKRVRPIAATIIGVLAGAVLTAIAVWTVNRFVPQRPLQLMRFAIVLPPGQPFSAQGADRDIAISPDGTKIVYRANVNGQPQFLVRSIDQLEGRVLAGGDQVRSPFISADSHWLGFFTGVSGELKKMPLDGGPPITLCRINAAPRGASWGPDHNIIFATSDPATGLLSIAEGGGEPRVLTKPDAAKGGTDHLYPFVLPGAQAVLFTITEVGQSAESGQIAVLDLKTGKWKILIRGGSNAEYVDTGHIVYAAGGTLRAVRFDPSRLEVLSDPVPVVEKVMIAGTGAAEFATSRTGSLIYMLGSSGATGPGRSLAWINRQGKEEPIGAPARAYVIPRISPDGTRAALDIRDQENDIWVWDFARKTLTRLTIDPRPDQYPVWTPDSARIIFYSVRDQIGNIYWQAANNTGVVERLTTGPTPQRPTSISRDGTRLVFFEDTPPTGNDIGMMTMGDKRTTETLIHSPFRELNPEISPDGRWIAYESDESGTNQVYVRPFPNVDGGHWQVSTGSGSRPMWARSGRELFYVDDAANKLMVVPVQTGGQAFSQGTPVKVFDNRVTVNGLALQRTFDISPDGQRFLVIKDNTATDQTSTATLASMVVVLNWTEELKQRVPTH
jgi:serine/threonine-protein kinase